MEPQIITSETEHAEMLAELDRLLAASPLQGTPAAARLELVAFLIEKWEKDEYPLGLPTPVDAIRFRMEEGGLSPRDLEPFIGSRSKVSEVLSGKIPLSLRMIRDLHQGFGIPYDVLVQEQTATSPEGIDFAKVPVREMLKRGWIDAATNPPRVDTVALARKFFASIPGPSLSAALFRQGATGARGSENERTSIAAWLAQASLLAQRQTSPRTFDPSRVTEKFMNTVARLSVDPRGPVLVRDVLAHAGIVMVILSHLPRTRLDGAAFTDHRGVGVIAMTLRYDRIDYFWHTLLHELAHLAKHQTPNQIFIDDLDLPSSTDSIEAEADLFAKEAVVPRQIWGRSDASRLKTPSAVLSLAQDRGVHPALIAGRLRHENKNFRLLSNLVGQGQIRPLFQKELGE